MLNVNAPMTRLVCPASTAAANVQMQSHGAARRTCSDEPRLTDAAALQDSTSGGQGTCCRPQCSLPTNGTMCQHHAQRVGPVAGQQQPQVGAAHYCSRTAQGACSRAPECHLDSVTTNSCICCSHERHPGSNCSSQRQFYRMTWRALDQDFGE